jgi:hypothetical protein
LCASAAQLLLDWRKERETRKNYLPGDRWRGVNDNKENNNNQRKERTPNR